jgi:hypothetical protein
MMRAKRRNSKYQNIKNGEKQRDIVLISKWKKRFHKTSSGKRVKTA